jgi:hypothetical protein
MPWRRVHLRSGTSSTLGSLSNVPRILFEEGVVTSQNLSTINSAIVPLSLRMEKLPQCMPLEVGAFKAWNHIVLIWNANIK